MFNSALRQVALATALTLTIGGMAVSPAKAVTWDLSSPTGVLGNTQTYVAGGLTLTASGFACTGCTDPNSGGTPTALFGKANGNQGGSIENGLGIAGTPGGPDSEIVKGLSFIEVQLPVGVTAAAMSIMGSTTPTEAWQVFGSNTGLNGSWTSVATGSDQGVSHLIQTGACTTCTFFAFFAVGNTGGGGTGGVADVLLGSITANAVPLPGALPLFATGLAALGWLGWRRKRKLVASQLTL